MILPVFFFTFLLANGKASAKRMGVDIVIDLEDSGDVEEKSSYGWMQRDPTFADRNKFGIGTQGQLTNLLCDHYDDLCGDGPYIPIAAYLTENELDDRWEKEFDKVGLPSVQFHMSAIEVEVLDSAAKPTVVKRSEMKNSSSKTITVNTGITSQQEETRTTSWSETHGFEIGQSFNYGIKLLGSGGGGETTFTFQTEWSEGEEISKTRTLGSSIGAEIELEPGEGVLVELVAFEGTMVVKTTYEIALEGDYTYVLMPRNGDPNFASIDNIETVLKDANLPSRFTVTESNEVGYYAHDKIEVHDLPSNKHLVDYHDTIEINTPIGDMD